MSILLIIALCFFAAALYAAFAVSLIAAIVLAVIGVIIIAVDRGGLRG